MPETNAPATIKQLEKAILSDVVTQFADHRESTSRFSLLIKFEGRPVSQAIMNLVSHGLIRNHTFGKATSEEEYLPTAAGFEFCGNPQLRNEAKAATTVVLRTLKEMFKREKKRLGLTFEDLERWVDAQHQDRIVESSTLKLGLYLAKDFNVISAYSPPDGIEVISFQIGESAISMGNPDAEWDRVMAGFTPRLGRASGNGQSSPAAARQEWEQIRPLGSGGQSDVFLVRSPDRVSERASCLEQIQNGDQGAELAEAIWTYSRPESPGDLGARKVFKIPPEGKALTPPPGTDEYEAIERLKNEIAVLNEGRPGLPKLMDSNLKERWIVTEYFPEGTLEQHPHKFRGNARSALKAFRSLVRAVSLIHKDGYVHRDIKLANVFIRKDDELVLGDFGIVYVPSLADRVTVTGERVGPRDYMPQWANLGTRNEKVEPCFDVYMLGKLLWSMVDGRMFLPREYYNRAAFDLTKTFPGNPDMFLINSILKACVVEEAGQCLSSGDDLLLAVDTTLRIMESGGQLLSDGVPRPCHVCGNGFYQVHRFSNEKATAAIRLWMSGGATDVQVLGVQLFSCDNCGNVQFFKS